MLPFYSDVAQKNSIPLPEEGGSVRSPSKTRAWFGRRLICQKSPQFLLGWKKERGEMSLGSSGRVLR